MPCVSQIFAGTKHLKGCLVPRKEGEVQPLYGWILQDFKLSLGGVLGGDTYVSSSSVLTWDG